MSFHFHYIEQFVFNRVLKLSVIHPSLRKRYAWKVHYAAHVIRQGGVIAHPTEAVWGLGCDPFNTIAIATILRLKQRPLAKGLILVSGQSEHFAPLIEVLPVELQSRFYACQRHPTTWLVPDIHNQVPATVKGEHDTVAIRVINHPVISLLSAALGHPVVSSSANPAGLAPAESLLKVRQYFCNQLDYILPAPLGKFSQPSIIKDLQTENIVRS